jgi:hypothetical protein
MTTRLLATVAAAIEVTAGCALIVAPTFVVDLLIGATLGSGGVAVGRLGGLGFLSLGLACWPSRDVVSAQAISALFTYNLLAALYIAHLSLVEGFTGYLVWPIFALHGLLAVLLAGPAYAATRREWRDVHFPRITMEIVSEVVEGPKEKSETKSKSSPSNSRVA